MIKILFTVFLLSFTSMAYANQCLVYAKFAETVAGDRDNGAARMDVRVLIASKELVDLWSYDYAFDIIDYVYTPPYNDPLTEAKNVYLACTGGFQGNYEF